MAHEEYLSVEEAAKRLRVGVETVRRYIRAGTFDVAKVGRQYLIKPASVTAFLEKQFAERKPVGQKDE